MSVFNPCGIYHYNPLTGEITYIAHRGPKKAGDSAIHVQNRLPYIRAGGQYVDAARIAWYLYTNTDPWAEGKYITPKDGNPFNLEWSNLELSDHAFVPATEDRSARRGRRMAEAGIVRCGMRLWKARVTHKGRTYSLGSFHSKHEAIAAKRDAIAALDAGREPDKGMDGRSRKNVERRIDYDRWNKLLVNGALEMQPGDNPDYAVVIDRLEHKNTRFANVAVGARFFYDSHFWIKISSLEAATCDWRPNYDRKIKLEARVKLILSMRLLSEPADL